MSLINNALKKAQRQRAEEATPAPVPGNSGRRPRRHGRAIPAQTLLLIVAGAALLIVLSIVATIYLMGNRPPPAAPVVATAKPTPPTPAAPAAQPAPVQSAPDPVVSMPVISAPASVVAPAPEPIPEPTPVVAAPPAPPVKIATQPPAPPPAETLPPKPSEKVYVFIDQLQVMGIRSSGAGSKVLMNDRVYRVNDIVNRELGLRLVGVTPESLTFVDASGASYTKNF